MQQPFENMFNIFDNETKKILLNSQKIANDFNNPISTDYLLLSILITPNTSPQKILKQYLKSKNNTKLILNTRTFKEKKISPHMTEEFQNILKLATDLSFQNQQKKIKSSDLLIAILKYKNCSAYKILKKLGLDISSIELQLKELKKSTSNIEGIYFTQKSQPQNLFSNENPFYIENPAINDFNTDNQQRSYLEEFGTNLTDLAKKNKLDKVIGRNKELQRLIQILCRRNKNNPVLVGEPGVGKSAIVEGLAQKIVDSKVPVKLLDKKIIMLDLASTVAGTMYRGQFETRMKNIIKEAKKDPNIILFIDEIHTVIGTGSAEGSMDTANILKPSLTKGNIRLIGATTIEEYRKNIEKDRALERRLQKILVNETNKQETLDILKNSRKLLESFHHVKITDQALNSAIELSKRYINNKFLPDKAIDILDETSAYTSISQENKSINKINSLNKKLKFILDKKEIAIQQQDFAQAAYLRGKELKIKQEYSIIKKKNNLSNKNHVIDEKQIAETISKWTQIPVDNLIIHDFTEIKNLDKNLRKEIIGQNHAVRSISQSIKKTKALLTDPHRPLGSFIFLGPTGVGKTELTKLLAKNLFGSKDKLIKLDMSEFMEKHNLSRLVGAPPGYVGYDDAGKLTEAVRNNPYSVILLDEIEKANPEVFNILLQIMEDGYLTDAKGLKINFKNTIIIMTSNIGVDKLNKQAVVGFNKPINSFSKLKNDLSVELKKQFKPEFLNRIDNIIFFKPLDIKSITKITKLQIEKLKKRLKKINYNLKISKDAINYLAQKSYLPEYGAREIRRVINKKITNKIVDLIINKQSSKNTISISFAKDKLIIKKI